MTFLEKLESGYFRMGYIDPLYVGEEGKFPRYHRGEVLTSTRFNEATDKVDEIAKKTNKNIETLLAAITSLNDDVNESVSYINNDLSTIKQDINELSSRQVDVDNITIKINDEGKLEFVKLPDSYRINSEIVDYHDPDNGQNMNMSIGKKIKNIEMNVTQIMTSYVTFTDKGLIENYE